MTCNEFNEKWKDYLEDRFYGLTINDQNVIDYLDKEFEKEIKVNPSFKYAQIKLKFGMSRVYADSDKTYEWEKKINELLKNESYE
jgi:hypothetical protein